jgi:tRNA(fMet)-specific endonuclease VapC
MLDSGIANEYLCRKPRVLARAKAATAAGHRIGICLPILGELIYGYEYSASRDENLRRLRVVLADWTIWPFDLRAARAFGRLRADRRRAGYAMQAIDAQLAAIALTLGNCTVVTMDSDLSAVPGLAVENWAA